MTEILPAEWPPRPGDVWLDQNGDAWFAVHFLNEELDEDEELDEEFVPWRVEGCEPNGEDVDDVRRWWGPLALAYRVPTEQRERDLAVAHDRQPYPTAAAYDRACAALWRHRERADKAEADRDRLASELDRVEADRDRIKDERARAVAEVACLAAERDQARTKAMVAREQREIARAWAKGLTAQRDELAEQVQRVRDRHRPKTVETIDETTGAVTTITVCVECDGIREQLSDEAEPILHPCATVRDLDGEEADRG